MTLLFSPVLRVLLVTAVAGAVGCGAGRTQTWAKTSAGGAQAASAGAASLEGDALWAKRDDRAQLEAALAAWDKALQAAPDDAELLVRLARGTYFLADGSLRQDKETYLKTFEKGVDYAERALTASSPAFRKRVEDGDQVKDAFEVVGKESVPALYWYSSNLGKWARAKGFATTLGNKDTIKAAMERCLALDPTFFFGGPDRYFGAFYAVAPAFAGGDLGKSEEHFLKSLELAPKYLATKVLMAENLAVKKQDKDLYRKLLEEVIAAPDDGIPELVPESRVEKQKAAELLKAIDDKF